MDKLSIELITLIFTQLHYEDKVKCMLVCRRFAGILRLGLDLETIDLSSCKTDDRLFKRLIERTEKNPGSGKLCKRMIMNQVSRYIPDYVTLGRLFPNLTCIIIGWQTHNSHIEPYSEDQCKHHNPWRCNLRPIIKNDCANGFLFFLDSGVFLKLTTLSMTYFPDADDPLFTRTCKSLKNAPNLTKLEVGLADIEIADLEELHKNLPKLYSFTIFSSTLSDSRENKAEIVRPTDNLKIFKANRLQYTGSFRIDNIDYFAKKYDSLQHMPFFIQGRIGADSCQKKIEEAFINFISNNNQTLKNLELDLPFSTTRILENIDMTKLEHIQTDVILSRRILAKNLSLVNHDNLKTLKLKNVPPIALECFKELTALVFLELAFKEKRGKKAPFAISQVATALPKLKTLSLLFPEIKIESNKNLLPSSLKHLYLANSETPDNFSDYLTRQVKCLRTLVLDDCKLEANFELPEHRLSLVSLHVSSTWPYHSANHVSNHRDSLGGAINLKLTIGNTTKYYNHRHGLHYEYQPVFKSEYFSKHDSTLRKSAKPGPFDSSKAYFNFMCADIQVFYFKGHVVM